MFSHLSKNQRLLTFILIGSLLVSAALKVWLLWKDVLPFNSDEAVVALMARHILQGERPVFFYGQAYMGSLDAWLVAAGFRMFGEQVWVIRMVQTLLYLGTLATTAWLGKIVFRRWAVGVLAAFFLAVPTVNVTLYTTVSLGGYGEALLIGNLVLILAFEIDRRVRAGDSRGQGLLWLVWGFLTGLGLWAFGLTLVYSLPGGFYLLWHLFWQWKTKPEGRRQAAWWVAAALLGVFAGSSPLWGFVRQNGFSLLFVELSGGAIAGVEQVPYAGKIFQHLVNLFLIGSTAIFGLRPPWGVEWLALPLLPFVLLFWMAVLVHMARTLNQPAQKLGEKWTLSGVGIILLLVFILTPFGADPSGRYFVPLAIPLALFGAEMVIVLYDRFGRWALLLPGLLLFANLWGTIQSAAQFPPGLTTQFYAPTRIDHRYDPVLINFLLDQGETRGYTNYWVTYPIAFQSREELIFVPRLPYHLDFRYTARDDRYAPYQEQVASAGQVAYITAAHQTLDQHIRSQFDDLGVTWREKSIGDYRVFYDLSRPVRPEELKLTPRTGFTKANE